MTKKDHCHAKNLYNRFYLIKRTVNWSNAHFVVLTASATLKGIQAKCANTQNLSWTLAVTINVFSFDTRRVLMSKDQKLQVS